MSYGIIRIEKYTAGSVRGIDIHDNRKKDVSHSNPDIDFDKSDLNYQIKSSGNKSFYNAVNDRIKELSLSKAVRKDAVVMAQVLVTSDNKFFSNLSAKQQEDFFQKAYDFIENRYGKENIISATVHLDETTPHMHVNFVPVTADGRLCAKDLLNRQEMRELQDNAFKKVFELFDLERGEIKEDKKKHLSVYDFKVQSRKEKLEKLDNILQSKQTEIKQVQLQYNSTLSEYEKIISAKEKTKKEAANIIGKAKRDSEEIINNANAEYKNIIDAAYEKIKAGFPIVTYKYHEKLKGENLNFGQIVEIDKQRRKPKFNDNDVIIAKADYINLIKTAAMTSDMFDAQGDMYSENIEFRSQIDNLKDTVKRLRKQIPNPLEQNQQNIKMRDLENDRDKYKSRLDNIPIEVQEQYNKPQTKQKNKNKSYGYDR